MIRLTKGPIPAILAQNAALWTKEVTDAIAAGRDPTPTQLSRYRHKDIKDALKLETHRKCAYCESKALHVTHGDVEHIAPKSVNPALSFDWQNLTLACDVCNTCKGNKEGFVDPYVDTPSDEIGFYGPMIFGLPGRNRAERTVTELGLNRIDLLERRKERLQALIERLRRLNETADEQQREFIRSALINFEAADDREYAACVRKWIADSQAAGHL